ncbi:flagellar basal-body MS-ring/collar protein FliF [Sneathiella sp.]|uniref:flagellar basal-body MS-ring/collar protein FliF n=1 Tax=Sneathiella sp. TaxID=1964365 RepID=UPI00261B179C|nr:flagellar basal-body MS-ring/collar protein FliF [Sneathiella sp.]MDF2365918.1 flagellar basal-body MS-ring/collar protein FliF [Sneathiella sp.]
MNGISQLLQSLGAVRVIILGGVAVGLIALIMLMATRISSPDFALLYGGLEPSDSAAIVSKLEAENIPFQIAGNGRDVLVPSDQVALIRLKMAEAGLPNGGSVGYEIFDNSDTFGTTSFVQNVNFVRALEGELARTIRALNNVSAARVHLVLPKREVFSRDKREASASIVLKLNGRGRLTDDQIAAIQHMTASAVPSLSPSHISIVDENGNLLARGDGKETQGSGISSQSDFKRIAYESHLKEQIEQLLEKSLGPGNIRAEVSAVMDFDQRTIQSETYDPDSQVVRSSQLVEENSSSNEGLSNDPAVSVANNLPEAGADTGGGSNSKDAASRTEETVNYEISKTITTEVRESGPVRRLTVAVLVNGRSEVAPDGTRSYEALSEDALSQVSRLVKSAIGYNEERGDVVEVVNMPFAEVIEKFSDEEIVTDEIFMGLTKADLFKMGEMGVLVIVAILALLLVVRPLLNRALATSAATPALAGPGGAAIAGALPGGGSMPAIAGSQGQSGSVQQSETLNEIESMIDIDKVDGQVKTSALNKVSEIVDKHPDEAISILRSWLYHDA